MKPIIQKIWIFMTMLWMSGSAFAYDFMSGDLYYNILSEEDRTVEVTFWAYGSDHPGDIEIPQKVIYNSKNYTVTSIGSRAFSGRSSLTSVTIPDSVTYIGELAFSGCSSLTSVTIPNSVTSIGMGAFEGCSSLTSVTIPNSVTSIGARAFGECSSLTSVTISNSVTSIEVYTFGYCSSLTSVTIPNSVTSIGYSAFVECSSLTSVTIPNSVTSIGVNAFEGCSSLTSVTIPNSVNFIETGAFFDCSELESINVDSENACYSSIDGILYNKDATTLLCCPGHKTSVTIPNSVTSIGSSAFRDCSSLISVTIPNSVTSIGDYAFLGCSSLTSVTIPNSVTYIGELAFSYCSNLTSVTIPNSVTSIEIDAFYECNLKTIYVQCEIPLKCGSRYSFSDKSYMEAVLYVPAGTKEAYKKVDPWRYFRNIEEMDPVAAETISLNQTTISLKINETYQLAATISPDNTTDKTVIWSSSDDRIAKVSDTGLVTGVSAGEAVIRSSCGDISAECKVSVSETTGIEEIATSPDSKLDVYNINGVMIKKACTVDDLHRLPKGIYIVISGNNRYKIAI